MNIPNSFTCKSLQKHKPAIITSMESEANFCPGFFGKLRNFKGSAYKTNNGILVTCWGKACLFPWAHRLFNRNIDGREKGNSVKTFWQSIGNLLCIVF